MTAAAHSRTSAFDPSSQLEQLLMESIRSKDVNVPPLAPAALRVQALVASGDYTVDSIAEVIQFDHMLSAAMMRRANSSTFSRGRSIESVQQAVRRLGGKETVNVALSASLGAIAGAGGPLQELRVAQWRDSALASLINQTLAPQRSIDPGAAFLCALFRDFPEIIAIGHVETLLRQHAALAGRLPPDAWYAMVRHHRDDLAQIVLEKWGLPPAVAAVIQGYKNPTACPPEYVDLAKSVGVAHIVCLLLKQNPTLDRAALGRTPGLRPGDAELLESKLGRILASVEEMQSTDAERAPSPSLVESPKSSLNGPLFPCCAEVMTAGKATEFASYDAVSVGFDGMVVTGPDELKINVLKKFTITSASGSFETFFNVSLVSSPTGGDHVVELKPFGLGGANKTAWENLVQGARDAA